MKIRLVISSGSAFVFPVTLALPVSWSHSTLIAPEPGTAHPFPFQTVWEESTATVYPSD